jgi:hypothetical protein
MKTAGLVLTTIIFAAVADPSFAQSQSGMSTGVGGTATTGTAVRTGRGALSQPVGPAASTVNPQQNYNQGGPSRPANVPGPASTYPSQQPFGSSR